MDAPHLDALTRRLTIGLNRRRGLVLLGILGLRGPAAPDAAVAKKKKKRCPPCKRRKKGKCRGTLADRTPCPGGSCQGGNCREGCLPTDQCCAADDCSLGLLCCDGVCTDGLRAEGASCDVDSRCCSNYCQFIRPGEKRCAPTCRGNACELDRECCRGVSCTEVGGGDRFCGGCIDVVAICEADADCCSSACAAPPGASAKICASLPGGPCARSANCRSCLFDGDCTVTVNGTPREICHDGVCGCPDGYECCSNFDCALDETCVFVTEAGHLTGECRPVLPG